MKNSRRTFIKQASFASAALWLGGSAFKQEEGEYFLGLQLYSVRDAMAADPADTLNKIAQIGYKYVEHANYQNGKFYGYTPSEFKKFLDSLGINMVSGHSVLDKKHWSNSSKDFTDEWKKTIADAAEAGQKYIISPWLDDSLRKTKDDLLRVLDIFNNCGRLCQKSGIKFGYHNHDFEFNTKLDGEILYDIILKNTDPSFVVQQMDTGNMYYTGGRPEELIERYPQRFELMHVKDEIPSENGEMGSKYESAVLGAGEVGIEQVIKLAEAKGGTKYFIVEQESYQGTDPLVCAEKNFSIMKSWGF